MKKLIILFLVISSTIATAQESVKLRLNYKKGDIYKMDMEMKQNSTAMGMTMDMGMTMSIKDVKGDSYLTEMSFKSMKMNVLQGGQEMNYDSDAKDEDLDDIGKMMKSQMAPMLTVVVKGTLSKLGKMSDVIITPNLPNSQDFAKSNNVQYPVEAVKVGSTWQNEETNQGMKSVIVYTVTEITKTKVIAKITGDIEGVEDASITGVIEIDKDSGIPLLSKMTTKMSAGGQDMSIDIKVTMTKL